LRHGVGWWEEEGCRDLSVEGGDMGFDEGLKIPGKSVEDRRR